MLKRAQSPCTDSRDCCFASGGRDGEGLGPGPGTFPRRLALHIPMCRGRGLVLCGSRCKSREMFQVSLGKLSSMRSTARAGRLERGLLVTQASRAQGPHGVTARRLPSSWECFHRAGPAVAWPRLQWALSSWCHPPPLAPRREGATSGGLGMANSAAHSLPSHTL